MITCRDCKYWKVEYESFLEDYPRNNPLERSYRHGYCEKISDNIHQAVDIEAHGGWEGAGVGAVNTDANFGCILGEKKD